jgi:hypothetical protein
MGGTFVLEGVGVLAELVESAGEEEQESEGGKDVDQFDDQQGEGGLSFIHFGK